MASISKTSISSADGWSFAIGLESEHLKLLNDELLRHFQEEYTEGSLSEERWVELCVPVSTAGENDDSLLQAAVEVGRAMATFVNSVDRCVSE